MLGENYDTVTLISHPQYFEISVLRCDEFRTPIREVCANVCSVILSTLANVTSHMNYSFNMGYKFAFECPAHPERLHLCTLADETAEKMECPQNPKRVRPISLKPCHRIWFPKRSHSPYSTSSPTKSARQGKGR